MSLISKALHAWNFNEGVGITAADAFGSANGTLTDDGLWTPDGKIGGGIENDGTLENYITVPSIGFPSRGAISVWVKTSSTNRSNLLGHINVTGAPRLHFAINYQPGVGGATAETIGFRRDTDEGDAKFDFLAAVGSALHDGEWHHVVANFDTQDAGSPEIWFDGVLQSVTVSSSNTQGGATFAPVIGTSGAASGNPNPSNSLNGSMDALTIFGDMLTAGEIAQLYNDGGGLELAIGIIDFQRYAAYTLVDGELRRISG